MVQILRNLHHPPILAGTVICVVFVFMNFHNHNMTAYIQERVGLSPWASTFYLPVTYPRDIRILFFYVRCYGGLLRLVVADDGLIREQMDKAMSFVFPVCCLRLAQWGLAQSRTTTILAILFTFIILTKCASTTNLAIVLPRPMLTKSPSITILAYLFSYTMGTPCTPTTRLAIVLTYIVRTQPSPTTRSRQ